MTQPPRATQQRVRPILRQQRRAGQQRQVVTRRQVVTQRQIVAERQAVAPRRAVQQRLVVQQRRGVQPQRVQQRGLELQRQLAQLRRQQHQARVWLRTATRTARPLAAPAGPVSSRSRETAGSAPLRPLAAPAESTSSGREPETYAAYVRRRTAEARTATVTAAARSAALSELWPAALASPLHVSFGSLRHRVAYAPFDAHGLDTPLAEPRAEDFQPVAAHLPDWVPGQRAARERARAAAYAEYRQAVADHRAAEFDRVRRLSVAKLEHQRREAAAAAAAGAHNAAVDRLQAGYRERDPAAVEEFARIVLSTRSWPEGVVLHWRLRYRPDFCQIDGDCVLPGPDVMPSARRYRYVAAADAIRRQTVPLDEVRVQYGRTVEQIALVALFDLFHGLAPNVVDVVRLNGVAAHGPALISVAVARSEWDALRPATDLVAQPPHVLLRRLDARVSPDPYEGVPVVPWAD